MVKTEKRVKIDNFEEINEEKTLFSWIAAERPFQRRNRDFWITAIAILVLVSVFLIFIKEFFLIVALVSVLFLYYVLSTVPPENTDYQITNRGIHFGDTFYPWSLLSRFWFKSNLSSLQLHIETLLRFPRQVSLVINPSDQEKIKNLIVKRIPLLESSPTFVDRLTKWAGSHLPLENRDKKITESGKA